MKKRKEKKKASMKFKFISRLLWILALGVTIFFGYELNKLNMLPTSYYLLVMGGLFLLMFILGAVALRKRAGKVSLSIVSFFAVVYIVIFGFGSLKIKDTVGFMEKNLGIKFETNVYYVLVNSDSEYKKIKDIKGLTVYSYKDQKDMKNVEKALNKKVNVDIEYKDSLYDLLNSLTADEDLVVYVNSGNYEVMVQNNEGYSKKVRILETIEIKTKKDVKNSKIDVSEDPFVILINGIDTRSDYLPSRSLSDVNMLMAINPNTHQILLLSIPRDYYITVPNTGGAKDKLTHTGTIGGVDTTIEALEDEFGIKISYYARVNFNFVTNLVDAVGGIDIYNDQSYGFTCWTDSGCYYEPGVTYGVSGRCALAFARERYAYETGDRHRIQNQQQVLENLFHKIASSKTLISSYSDILNALSGTFETNLSNEDISKLVKLQIKDMPNWEVYKYSVDGSGTSAYTYSYPNQALYVMIPDESTVTEAKTRLKTILEIESD
jgi:LCP family protein required for cell wall assembly